MNGDLQWLVTAFTVANSMRAMCYLPQIAAVLHSRDGARDIALLSWSMWAVNNLLGAAYAGLVAHLPNPVENLRELARVVRPGGKLALFHPIGRAALAARQGRQLTPADLRAEVSLGPLLSGSGWRMTSYVDEDARFLALAVRDS